MNFQESTTILNACTKIVWKLIEGTLYDCYAVFYLGLVCSISYLIMVNTVYHQNIMKAGESLPRFNVCLLIAYGLKLIYLYCIFIILLA